MLPGLDNLAEVESDGDTVVGQESAAVELRNHRRYEISLPVRVHPKGPYPPIVNASSRDISSKGIYLIFPGELQVGSEFEFEIMLPKSISKDKDIWIKARANVVRLDKLESDEITGIAARIENYKFRRTG